MLRNRSGRLVAIMFAGSFVLAGVGGCIAGAEEAETDREATAGGESSSRDNTGADGRSGGQTRGDRQSRAGGRQSGREQAGRQSGRQIGEQAGYQGGSQGGGQRAGAEQACGEQAGYQGGSAQSGGHSAMRQVSEQELATLVSIINRQEVKLSKIALEKAESPEVQRFAEAMIDEHSRAQQHGIRLSRGAATSIEACPQCQQLQADAVETSESLQEQEGAEFDVAFIWAQVSLHRRALEILDEPLVERTKSTNLRSLLMTMRSDVEQHLRRAEQIFCTLLQARQQQSGQQSGAQQPSQQKSPQQQGQQSAQQQGQQSAQQQGQQSAQLRSQQSAQLRGQQQGAQFQGQQQRGQQRGAQFQGQQQRGQQQGAQFQGQQQRGQQQGDQFQGQQSAQQQRDQRQGGQSQGQQSSPQGPLR